MKDVTQLKDFIYSVFNPTSDEWKNFEQQLKIRQWRANDVIFSEGDICNEILFINKGAVRTYYLKNDEEVNTFFAFENDFIFHYESFLTKTPMKSTIQTLENTVTISISRDIIFNTPDVFYNWNQLGRVITEQLYLKLLRRTENFISLSGEKRYLELVNTYSTIFERVPLYHIASYIGIAGPSLSRIRNRLTKKTKSNYRTIKNSTRLNEKFLNRG